MITKQVGIGSIKVSSVLQPRKTWDDDKMESLIESVKSHGILEPLLVRRKGRNEYELVAGERRLRAATAIGMQKVPVTIKDLTDLEAQEIALVENLQRVNLNPIEETEGVLALLSLVLEMTQKEVVSLFNRAANTSRRSGELADSDQALLVKLEETLARVGIKNRETFRTNRLPLLNLPPDVKEVVRDNRIEYTKAKVIAKVEDEPSREKLIEKAVSESLSLVEIKKEAQILLGSHNQKAEELKQRIRQLTMAEFDWGDSSKHGKIESALEKLESLIYRSPNRRDR